MKDLSHYTSLAGVFKYPDPGTKKMTAELEALVRIRAPEFMPQLNAFTRHILSKSIAELQEYYIGTFDVQALCYLDIGYMLFGEDYKRGEFLVHMKNEQKKAENDCGSELPDHLPNVLTLLPKLEDELLAEELTVSLMIPALEKMIASFNSEENVYKGMLEILLAVMKHDYPESAFERFSFSIGEKTKNFECLPQWMTIK
jgi:nitrate reductase molybdenum cofactor assembly chaperone